MPMGLMEVVSLLYLVSLAELCTCTWKTPGVQVSPLEL